MTNEEIAQMVDKALEEANREDDLDEVKPPRNATRRHMIALCLRIRDLCDKDSSI